MPIPTGGPVAGNESVAVTGVPEGLPADVAAEIEADLRQAHEQLRPPTPEAPASSNSPARR